MGKYRIMKEPPGWYGTTRKTRSKRIIARCRRMLGSTEMEIGNFG